jgi:hypothetical protein
LGSIPIARSTFRCVPLAFVLGGHSRGSPFPKSRCAPIPVTRFAILTMQNRTLVARPPKSEIQREGCLFVRQSTNYWGGRAKAIALQYYQS